MILTDRDPGTGEPIDYPDDMYVCREHEVVVCPSQGRYCEHCERAFAIEDARDLRERIDEALQGITSNANELAERLEGYGMRFVQGEFRAMADAIDLLRVLAPPIPNDKGENDGK